MAERRVGRWTALGLVAVLVALTAVLGVWVVLRLPSRSSDTAAQPIAQSTAGAGQSLFAALPARIAAAPNTPDLPADPVGRAGFIYVAGGSGSPVYVVTVDGTPYRVGAVPDGPRPVKAGLSPDGRWLVRERDGQWVVRDLTSRVEHSVGRQKVPNAWSVDGRALLWYYHISPERRRYEVMDTDSGRMTDVAFTEPPEQSPVVMFNDHELATVDYRSFERNERVFSVDVVDVRNGAKLRSVPVDLSAHMRPGERIMVHLTPMLVTSGRPTRLWIAVGVEEATTGRETVLRDPIGAVGIDLTSGRFLIRSDWSRSIRSDTTMLAGAVADGAVLARMTIDTTEVSIVSDTGERRVVTRLPGRAFIYPAGSYF